MVIKSGTTFKVLDRGFVRYIDHLGSDLRVVEAARISYKSPSKGEEGDKKLLNYLYKHKHTSPFEQCSITFNIKLPIFIMRQLVRHRTFRLNEWSGRYSELLEDFYIPKKWRSADYKNKQGSNLNPQWDEKTSSNSWSKNEQLSELLLSHCEDSYDLYKELLEEGVAKEMARMVLPLNIYTEIYLNCDLHNLMHFLRLRQDSHSQWEIQQYANAMYKIMERIFPWTAEAFKNFK